MAAGHDGVPQRYRSGTGRVTRPDMNATVSWSEATRDGMGGPAPFSASPRDCLGEPWHRGIGLLFLIPPTILIDGGTG